MGLYKNAGGHAITTTIVEEAWAGQTYGEGTVKFPSMVKWTKKADGKWSFDYTDFDKKAGLTTLISVSMKEDLIRRRLI